MESGGVALGGGGTLAAQRGNAHTSMLNTPLAFHSQQTHTLGCPEELVLFLICLSKLSEVLRGLSLFLELLG